MTDDVTMTAVSGAATPARWVAARKIVGDNATFVLILIWTATDLWPTKAGHQSNMPAWVDWALFAVAVGGLLSTGVDAVKVIRKSGRR